MVRLLTLLGYIMMSIEIVKVELIHKTTNNVIASWDYSALTTDNGKLSINNVKSILKSLQLREE